MNKNKQETPTGHKLKNGCKSKTQKGEDIKKYKLTVIKVVMGM